MSAFKELYKHAYDLFQDGNYSEAQNTLNRAEELYNEYDEELINKEDVYILRGTIAIAQNDIDYAKELFETALKINPKSAEACMGLGQIFFSLDMKNEAKTMFEWAVINEPKNEIDEQQQNSTPFVGTQGRLKRWCRSKRVSRPQARKRIRRLNRKRHSSSR